MLIDIVRKPPVKPIVLAKQWGITMQKAQKTIQATTQRRRLCLTLDYPDDSEQMIVIFVIITWYTLYFRCDVCHYSFQKGRQMCIRMCHKLWMGQSFPNGIQKWSTRSCHCCLYGMVFHEHVFVTMPGKWSKVSFTRTLKMLHFSRTNWNSILPCQMWQKER